MAVNFAVSGARAQARTRARDPRQDVKLAATGWRADFRERRENDLKSLGVVIPLSDWLGHNNGPDLLQNTIYAGYCWRKAAKAAFAPPDAETGRRWAEKAQRLGLSYREYRLELLERGRHPTDEDATRIIAARLTSARLSDV